MLTHWSYVLLALTHQYFPHILQISCGTTWSENGATTALLSAKEMIIITYLNFRISRHPSNLMLDRMSGKIIHIDFGDCFEVAMNREKFPEKIPFRLTRMLINAMEVGKLLQIKWKNLWFYKSGIFWYMKLSASSVLTAFAPKNLWSLLPTAHLQNLTHWTLDKMVAISLTIFSGAFLWMKTFAFWLKFHWSLFLMVQLTISQHCFR